MCAPPILCTAPQVPGPPGNITGVTINGEFVGWTGDTLFPLSTGDLWMQASPGYLYSIAYYPQVEITEVSGTYYLTLLPSGDQVAVLPVSAIIESRVAGDYEGLQPGAIFDLGNGHIWRQLGGPYKIDVAILPKAIVFEAPSGPRIAIEGIAETAAVERLQ